MCAIIASFNKQKVLELVRQNQHRGRIAYSIALYGDDSGINHIKYGEGEFDEKILTSMDTKGKYIICHLQSPTSVIEKEEEKVHPSVLGSDDDRSYLWHNGILMPSSISKLQDLYGDSTFDTHLLHHWLLKQGKLDAIEGSFACVYVKEKGVEIFRSKHAKLYIDAELTISSERFAASKCINDDRIYVLDIPNRGMKVKSYFTTKRYNMIIKGELDD